MEALIEEGEEIVGDDAFEEGVVEEAKLDPEAVEFGSGEEGAALRIEIFGEIAHEVDGADFGEREFLMFAIGGEQIDGSSRAEGRGIEIARVGLAVEEFDDHFLVSRG